PYRFPGLARLAHRLLGELGYNGAVDALGVSWGGALAQTFAFQFPTHCRKLVLASTSPGALMVPGRPSVLAKLVSPRRYVDPDFLHAFGGEIYGGAFRSDPDLLRRHAQAMWAPSSRGYLYQLIAAAGWTSLPWLRLLPQPTLVMHGSDDPIVPLINARILSALIRRAELHVVDDGHMFLVSKAQDVAPVVHRFLTPAQYVHSAREEQAMSTYSAPVRDMQFAIEELADLKTVATLAGYEDATPDLVNSVLEEAAKFAGGVWAPLDRAGDVEGPRWNDGHVAMPAGF